MLYINTYCLLKCQNPTSNYLSLSKFCSGVIWPQNSPLAVSSASSKPLSKLRRRYTLLWATSRAIALPTDHPCLPLCEFPVQKLRFLVSLG